MSDKQRIYPPLSMFCLPFLFAVCSLMILPTAAFAADEVAIFKDPTRPPVKFIVTPPVVEIAPPIVEVIVETKRAKPRAKPKARSLRLTSVLVSEQRRRAVINGRVVKEGQSVAGARILKIALNGVTVRRAGRTQTLRLVRASVKRRSTSMP